MELEANQEKLSKALNVVSRIAAGAKTTLPVLNNVLIRVEDKKVTLTATNLDMAIVDYLPVSSSKNGVITAPAKLLAEFISNLPKNEKITITNKNEKVTIKSGKYSSVINGTSPDDFPELPEIDDKTAVKFKMGIDEFKNGVNEVVIASSNDMTRPALTGVYFNTFEGDLYIASTDGYRLAERKFIEKVKSEIAAIVPTSSLQEVMRSINEEMEDIEILFDEAQVRFRLGEIEITSKLIDGSFPDYRQLIPKKASSSVVLDRSELTRVTKLAALFAREVGGSIVCEAKLKSKVFSVSSVANEFGENDSEISAEIKKDDKVTLNSRFLMDALNVLEEKNVIFNFSDNMLPIVIKNEKNNNYTHIIMPLKA